MSTQAGFGRILDMISRQDSPLADRIMTTSPDVTVSTNLGPWVNRRGLFSMQTQEDVFKERGLMSPQRWEMSPQGQHLELGIAEMNLFLALGAAGLSHTLFGERVIPIGTLYDPFISRGLDALNYACYQDARFILVATPSGLTLAPEGGAHQSLASPLIGMSQDGLASFEPAYVDELAAIMAWAFDYVQRSGDDPDAGRWPRDENGGSVYLRLSTRPLQQLTRTVDDCAQPRDRRWRLLAAPAGPVLRSRDRIYGRGGAGSGRGSRLAQRGLSRHRRARHHVGRSPLGGVACRAAGPRPR